MKKLIIGGWALLLAMVGGVLFYVILNYLSNGIPFQYAYDLGTSAQIQAYFIKIFAKFGLVGFFESFKWRGDISGPTFVIFSYFYTIFDALFIYLLHDVYLAIKSIQVFEYLLAFTFMYLMTNHFTKNKYISLLAGILYTANPLFLIMLSGNLYMAWAFTILPLSIMYIDKYISCGKKEFAILSGILFSMTALFSQIEFIFFFGMFLIIFCFFATLIQDKMNYLFTTRLFSSIKIIFIVLSIALMTSSYFLIPTFHESPIYSQFSEEALNARKQYEALSFYSNHLIESLSFQFKELKVSLVPDINTSKIPKIYIFYVFLVYTILSIYSLFLEKNRVINSIFFLIGMIGILLSLGPTELFPDIYKFLFNYVPYFDMIRTPDRFVFISVIAFSFLSSNSIYAIINNIKIPKSEDFKVAIFLILIFTMTLVFLKSVPLFQTQQNPDQTYPDVEEVQNFLQHRDPAYHYRALDLTIAKNGNPSFINYYSIRYRYLQNQWDIADRYYQMDTFANILGQMNIKYIITSPDWGYNVLLPDKKKIIYNNPDFKEILRTSNGVRIFENKLAEPRIYVADPILVFGGPNAFEFNRVYAEQNNYTPTYVFASQMSSGVFSDLNKYNHLLFYDSNYMDVIYSEIDSKYKYEPFNYIKSDWTILHDIDYRSKYGVLFNDKSYRNSFLNERVLSNNLISSNNGTLNIPFNVEYDLEYRILARVYYYENSSFLTSSIDNKYFMTYDLKNKKGFRWLNIGAYNFSRGSHTLNLTTKGSDRVYIDTIVIIPSFELDELSYKIKGKISGSNSEKIYLYDSDQYMARSENKDIGQIFSGEFEIFESGDYLLRIYTSDNLSMRSLAIDDIDLDHFNESDYGINVKITKGFHNLTYIVPNSINKTSIFIYFIKNNLNNPQNYNNKTQINFKESAPNRFEISFDKKGENNIRNPILVFTDTYSPSWKLYSSNGEYNHLPVNYQMNGFLINDTRLNNKYILEYNVSDLRKIGILFTTIPFLVLIYIIYYKYKKGWEKLKR